MRGTEPYHPGHPIHPMRAARPVVGVLRIVRCTGRVGHCTLCSRRRKRVDRTDSPVGSSVSCIAPCCTAAQHLTLCGNTSRCVPTRRVAFQHVVLRCNMLFTDHPLARRKQGLGCERNHLHWGRVAGGPCTVHRVASGGATTGRRCGAPHRPSLGSLESRVLDGERHVGMLRGTRRYSAARFSRADPLQRL